MNAVQRINRTRLRPFFSSHSNCAPHCAPSPATTSSPQQDEDRCVVLTGGAACRLPVVVTCFFSLLLLVRFFRLCFSVLRGLHSSFRIPLSDRWNVIIMRESFVQIMDGGYVNVFRVCIRSSLFCVRCFCFFCFVFFLSSFCPPVLFRSSLSTWSRVSGISRNSVHVYLCTQPITSGRCTPELSRRSRRGKGKGNNPRHSSTPFDHTSPNDLCQRYF